MKNTIITVVVLFLLVVGVYFLTRNSPEDKNNTEVPTNTEGTPVAEPTPEPENKTETVIGQSVNENDIVAYHYGEGDEELLFVGGIHGGYSWNTSLVAYEMADYLKANPNVIPEKLKVTVIPVLNPDGLEKVTGSTGRFVAADVSASRDVQVSGRFNGNGVDINRNFDCDWAAKGVWQSTTVSGGTKAFSEPEALAIKNYIEVNDPIAVVVWYSAAGGVFASSCHDGVLPETLAITNAYAKASGYPASLDFDFYKITGDLVNWLAKEKVPAISVLLTNHEDVEWNKNKAGLEALLKYYNK